MKEESWSNTVGKIAIMLTALFFVALSTQAFAQAIHHNVGVGVGYGGDGGYGGAGGAGGNAKATAIGIGLGGAGGAGGRANAKAIQGQIQGQQQQQGQSQGQVSNQSQYNKQANKQIGIQGISNVGNSVFTGRKNLRNAPSFGLPFMAPTAICQGTLAGGFSFWLGGAAGAGTYTIDLCMQMETIRVGVYMMQNATDEKHKAELQDANKEIYCIMKWAKPTSMCAHADQDNNNGDETASTGTDTVVATFEPKKVDGIPDVTHEPKRAKIWFFGL